MCRRFITVSNEDRKIFFVAENRRWSYSLPCVHLLNCTAIVTPVVCQPR